MLRITRLISAIHRVQENILERYARSNWGLTAGQLRLVLALVPDQPVRTLELARRLYTDPGTVSGLLRRLTRKGMVLCRQSPDDRRVQMVSLTPFGVEVRNEFQRRSAGELPTAAFAEKIPATERQSLLHTLTKYAGHLMGTEDLQQLLACIDELAGASTPV